MHLELWIALIAYPHHQPKLNNSKTKEPSLDAMIDAGRGNRLFKGANQNPRLQPPRNVQSEEYSKDVSAIH